MPIDQDRIQAILKGRHSYYGGRAVPTRKDTRWHPGTGEIKTTHHVVWVAGVKS